MKLYVNGKEIDFHNSKLQSLIDHYKLKPKSIVIEKNGEVINRESFDEEELKDGDIIEIVRFVGGG